MKWKELTTLNREVLQLGVSLSLSVLKPVWEGIAAGDNRQKQALTPTILPL